MLLKALIISFIIINKLTLNEIDHFGNFDRRSVLRFHGKSSERNPTRLGHKKHHKLQAWLLDQLSTKEVSVLQFEQPRVQVQILGRKPDGPRRVPHDE